MRIDSLFKEDRIGGHPLFSDGHSAKPDNAIAVDLLAGKGRGWVLKLTTSVHIAVAS